jgi:hypothetical protein
MLLSVSGVRLHRSFRPLSMGLVDGRRASRILSKRFIGRLISARRELTLTVQGDFASHSDLRFLGVAAVAMMALLVGLPLEVKGHVVMPMVVRGLGVGLT